MSIPADVLRTHLAYAAWASRRIVDAASRLSPDELKHDFKTADGSVLKTLAHVYAADRAWLARVRGQSLASFITDADYRVSVLQNDWPALLESWRAWALDLTDERARSLVSYTDLKGNSWQNPLWQIVLHVVNHGTHHRGQVAGFIRSLGHTPPPLDEMAYFREQAIAAVR